MLIGILFLNFNKQKRNKMKKKNNLITLLSAMFLFILITACDANTTEYQIEDTAVDSEQEASNFILAKDLDDDLKESLIFIREEEKLARDIYLSLYNTHGLRVFNNIAKSEQKHMDAVKFLLDLYEIDDPITEDVLGIFQNTDLQNLYDELLQQGNNSQTDALKVGAAIEEIDILDLLKIIENGDVDEDILTVYNNLKKGSENHLRAFVRNLLAAGINYEAQYLDSDYYSSIINR